MTLREWATKGRFNCSFNGYILQGDHLRHGLQSWPIAGARAQCDTGASDRRMTATRIGAGAVVLGPLGAILGGMAKKDTTRIYILIEMADGVGVSFDAPVKEEKKARDFVRNINSASEMFSS